MVPAEELVPPPPLAPEEKEGEEEDEGTTCGPAEGEEPEESEEEEGIDHAASSPGAARTSSVSPLSGPPQARARTPVERRCRESGDGDEGGPPPGEGAPAPARSRAAAAAAAAATAEACVEPVAARTTSSRRASCVPARASQTTTRPSASPDAIRSGEEKEEEEEGAEAAGAEAEAREEHPPSPPPPPPPLLHLSSSGAQESAVTGAECPPTSTHATSRVRIYVFGFFFEKRLRRNLVVVAVFFPLDFVHPPPLKEPQSKELTSKTTTVAPAAYANSSWRQHDALPPFHELGAGGRAPRRRGEEAIKGKRKCPASRSMDEFAHTRREKRIALQLFAPPPPPASTPL